MYGITLYNIPMKNDALINLIILIQSYSKYDLYN